MKKYLLITTFITSALAASLSFAATDGVLTLREEKLGYQSLNDSKYACVRAAETYLKLYTDVVCEPVLKTSVRTLRWNTIVADQVYAGSVTSSYSTSSSHSSSYSSVFSGEILSLSSSIFGRFISAISCNYCADSGSSSSSYTSSSTTETPVYSTVHKSIPQFKDEVIEDYGYRLLTSQKEAQINRSTEMTTTFDSGKHFGNLTDAADNCKQYASILSGYRIVGNCHISQSENGLFTWTYAGQNYFKQ